MDYKSESKPKKNTVVSLAIAIGFDEEKRKEFIMLGGYLYPVDDRDKKIEECINNGIKTVPDINDKLSENGYDILTKDNYNTKEKSQNKNKTFHRKKPDKTAKSRS